MELGTVLFLVFCFIVNVFEKAVWARDVIINYFCVILLLCYSLLFMTCISEKNDG